MCPHPCNIIIYHQQNVTSILTQKDVRTDTHQNLCTQVLTQLLSLSPTMHTVLIIVCPHAQSACVPTHLSSLPPTIDTLLIIVCPHTHSACVLKHLLCLSSPIDTVLIIMCPHAKNACVLKLNCVYHRQ